MKRTHCYLLPALALLFCGSVSAQITFFNVGNGDVTGLKNAINSSNSNGTDDIINLATNGTYTLAAVDHVTNGATGLPIIGADNNHHVTIHGHGATITRSGSTAFRILEMAANANVSIDSLTISNGSIALFAPGRAVGAGIYNNGGTLALTTCTFDSNSNHATNGGDGISSEPNGNDGDSAYGGAILSTGPLTVTGCLFNNNTAAGGKGGNGFNSGTRGLGGVGAGGAIALGAPCTITSSTFTSNATANGVEGSGNFQNGVSSGEAYGGAIAAGAFPITVSRCTFSNNSALGYVVDGFEAYPGTGGAINCPGGPFSPPRDSFQITACEFANNHADYGGAAVGGKFTNCTFEGNTATDDGGAIASLGTSSFLGSFDYQHTMAIDSTFYSNTASRGGAVSHNGIGISTVTNCTLVSNNALSMGGAAYGAILTNSISKGGSPTNFVSNSGIVSNGHNLSDDAAAGDGTTGPGGVLNQTGDIRNSNPLIVSSSPQDNGGFTKTFAIGIFGSSPAINAGDDGYAPHRDQRGYFRTGRSDIGAYEYFGGVVGGSSIARSGNNVIVSAEVIYGHSYQLERKLNLSDSSWTAIGNEFLATDNDIEPAPPASDLSLGRAFYHVRFTN